MNAPLSVADVLERAADLIEPEGKWTQQFCARDNRGEETSDLAPDAVCFCAVGATARAARDLKLRGMDVAADDFLDELVGGSITQWNDAPERTQAEVVAKLREAAALAREQQA